MELQVTTFASMISKQYIKLSQRDFLENFKHLTGHYPCLSKRKCKGLSWG